MPDTLTFSDMTNSLVEQDGLLYKAFQEQNQKEGKQTLIAGEGSDEGLSQLIQDSHRANIYFATNREPLVQQLHEHFPQASSSSLNPAAKKRFIEDLLNQTFGENQVANVRQHYCQSLLNGFTINFLKLFSIASCEIPIIEPSAIYFYLQQPKEEDSKTTLWAHSTVIGWKRGDQESLGKLAGYLSQKYRLTQDGFDCYEVEASNSVLYGILTSHDYRSAIDLMSDKLAQQTLQEELDNVKQTDNPAINELTQSIQQRIDAADITPFEFDLLADIVTQLSYEFQLDDWHAPTTYWGKLLCKGSITLTQCYHQAMTDEMNAWQELINNAGNVKQGVHDALKSVNKLRSLDPQNQSQHYLARNAYVFVCELSNYYPKLSANNHLELSIYLMEKAFGFEPSDEAVINNHCAQDPLAQNVRAILDNRPMTNRSDDWTQRLTLAYIDFLATSNHLSDKLKDLITLLNKPPNDFGDHSNQRITATLTTIHRRIANVVNEWLRQGKFTLNNLSQAVDLFNHIQLAGQSNDELTLKLAGMYVVLALLNSSSKTINAIGQQVKHFLQQHHRQLTSTALSKILHIGDKLLPTNQYINIAHRISHQVNATHNKQQSNSKDLTKMVTRASKYHDTYQAAWHLSNEKHKSGIPTPPSHQIGDAILDIVNEGELDNQALDALTELTQAAAALIDDQAKATASHFNAITNFIDNKSKKARAIDSKVDTSSLRRSINRLLLSTYVQQSPLAQHHQKILIRVKNLLSQEGVTDSVETFLAQLKQQLPSTTSLDDDYCTLNQEIDYLITITKQTQTVLNDNPAGANPYLHQHAQAIGRMVHRVIMQAATVDPASKSRRFSPKQSNPPLTSQAYQKLSQLMDIVWAELKNDTSSQQDKLDQLSFSMPSAITNNKAYKGLFNSINQFILQKRLNNAVAHLQGSSLDYGSFYQALSELIKQNINIKNNIQAFIDTIAPMTSTAVTPDQVAAFEKQLGKITQPPVPWQKPNKKFKAQLQQTAGQLLTSAKRQALIHYINQKQQGSQSEARQQFYGQLTHVIEQVNHDEQSPAQNSPIIEAIYEDAVALVDEVEWLANESLNEGCKAATDQRAFNRFESMLEHLAGQPMVDKLGAKLLSMIGLNRQVAKQFINISVIYNRYYSSVANQYSEHVTNKAKNLVTQIGQQIHAINWQQGDAETLNHVKTVFDYVWNHETQVCDKDYQQSKRQLYSSKFSIKHQPVDYWQLLTELEHAKAVEDYQRQLNNQTVKWSDNEHPLKSVYDQFEKILNNLNCQQQLDRLSPKSIQTLLRVAQQTQALITSESYHPEQLHRYKQLIEEVSSLNDINDRWQWRLGTTMTVILSAMAITATLAITAGIMMITGGLSSLPIVGVATAVALVATSSEVVLGGVGAYYCHKQQHNTQSQRLINSMEAFSFWFQRRGYEPKIESDRVERANSLTQS